MKVKIIAFVCCLVTLLCLNIMAQYDNQGYNPTPANVYCDKEQKKLKSGVLPTPTLCGGYSSDQQMAIPDAMIDYNKGKVVLEGSTKSIINFHNETSYDKIQQELRAHISIGGSIDIFSGSAEAKYARYIKEEHYSQSFYFLESIALPKKSFQLGVYGPDALTSSARQAYNADPDRKMFRYICGDQFVQQITYGAKLFVTFKANFNSLWDRQEFSSHVKASFLDILGGSASVQALIDKYHIDGILEVSAMQIGGNPTRLANIFTKSPSGDYYVATASLKNLKALNGIINGVLDYAKNDFINQVDFKDGQYVGNAAPIDYYYRQYKRIMIQCADSILTPEGDAARKELGDTLNKDIAYKIRIDHILNSAIQKYLVRETREELEKISADLRTDINILNNSALDSYTNPEHAEKIAKKIIQNLKCYNNPRIEALTNIFKYARYAQNDHGYYGWVIPVGESQEPKYKGRGGIVEVSFMSNDWNNYQSTGTKTFSKDKETIYWDGRDYRGDKIDGTYHRVSGTPNIYSGTDNYHGRSYQLTTEINMPNPT